MKKEAIRKHFFIISLIVSIISLFVALMGYHYWFYPATIGVWLFFDYLSSRKNKNKTAFSLILNKKYKKFANLYIALAVLGYLIEFIGQYLLKWWYYPELSEIALLITIPIFYPFILMSFKEMYETIRSFLNNKTITVISAVLLEILIWEVPNFASKDWIYTITYFPEYFGLNIVIIIGWIFLIIAPVYTYNRTVKF